ncbi:ABC transporter ATP-binding protein [Romboutsia weinsteinii]|uniref:ABC transporter ATP-binding protein n=1 Tax=Romboutsia weinsteinii TaxID=2020949 RepID=A0A371J3E9_9FIRM|nr:ABC transporter ATP-binding protein [Romboutsia weinsteinii]RDY27197.1 ABC transporter ATP-binding protein [Romboutsia weinsteinii]
MISFRKIKKNMKNQKKFTINKLDLKKGYVYAILGHNGSGKSTLLKLLYGITNFESGSIIINKEGFNEKIVHKYISYHPQDTCYLSGSLEDNFDYIYKYSNNEDLLDRGSLNELIKEFGLEDMLDINIKRLSGGEQAKFQFIRTLIMNKECILLDEPMASMDFDTIRIVEKKIKDLKEKNKTILLVTHDFLQAERLSDEVIFMQNLNIVEKYKSENFFKDFYFNNNYFF